MLLLASETLSPKLSSFNLVTSKQIIDSLSKELSKNNKDNTLEGMCNVTGSFGN